MTGVGDSVTWGQQDRFCWENSPLLIWRLPPCHTRLIYIAPLAVPLDPQQTAQNQQTEAHPLSAKRKALSPEQAALKTDYQAKLEKGGVLQQTAEPASYDLATGKGAKDSRYISAAQQELHRHQLLKNMYQGIYEKHGVSPEVAATAADQLARGNGVTRSPNVRKAHEQSLNNIDYVQQSFR